MLFPLAPAAADPALADPRRVACVMCDTGETITFGELDARANQVAQVLRACGVGPGEHFALLMSNHRRFLETCFGADRAGVYYTTISTRLAVDEIAYIVGDCGAKILVASADLGDVVDRLRPLLPGPVRCFAAGGEAPGYESWEAIVDAAPGTPIADGAQGQDMRRRCGIR